MPSIPMIISLIPSISPKKEWVRNMYVDTFHPIQQYYYQYYIDSSNIANKMHRTKS